MKSDILKDPWDGVEINQTSFYYETGLEDVADTFKLDSVLYHGKRFNVEIATKLTDKNYYPDEYTNHPSGFESMPIDFHMAVLSRAIDNGGYFDKLMQIICREQVITNSTLYKRRCANNPDEVIHQFKGNDKIIQGWFSGIDGLVCEDLADVHDEEQNEIYSTMQAFCGYNILKYRVPLKKKGVSETRIVTNNTSIDENRFQIHYCMSVPFNELLMHASDEKKGRLLLMNAEPM